VHAGREYYVLFFAPQKHVFHQQLKNIENSYQSIENYGAAFLMLE